MPGNLAAIGFAAGMVVLGSLAGCSRTKTIDREQAQSELRSARSLAAESDLFLELVLQGSASRKYAEGHATYLQALVEQSRKGLEQAVAEADALDVVRECRTGLGLLAGELSATRAAILANDRAALGAARGKIQKIGESLATGLAGR